MSMASATEYLCIEPFLHDALQARMLQAAFELGVIDLLLSRGQLTRAQLFRNRPCDAAGAKFLVEVLTKANVLQVSHDRIALTPAFSATLKYRDLLQAKLHFAGLVAPDFFVRLPQLLSSADEFMATSSLFELFDYSRCHEVTPDNCLRAARWMNLTSALTRYEGPVCDEHFNFEQHRRCLDMGGNSGEFALQICLRHSELTVTVADLPVVCHVGASHIAATPESERIQFRPLHFLNDALPSGHDLITFKSVLHDWPDEPVEWVLTKSFQALEPGGRILIFERQQWDSGAEQLSYGLLPVLLFFRSYRDPESYLQLLRSIGFVDVSLKRVQLEVPFMILTARKPGS